MKLITRLLPWHYRAPASKDSRAPHHGSLSRFDLRRRTAVYAKALPLRAGITATRSIGGVVLRKFGHNIQITYRSVSDL
jgi:hypothetical protein